MRSRGKSNNNNNNNNDNIKQRTGTVCMAKSFMPLVQAAIHHRDCDSQKGDGVGQQQLAYVIGFHEWRCGCCGLCKLEIAAAHHHKLSVPTATSGPAIKALVWLAEELRFNTASALLLSSQVVVYGH